MIRKLNYEEIPLALNLTDARANPTYKTEQVIMIVLLGF